ncbi:MAG: putative DNA-binding domain-containing protein [Candidatus Berkiellales bacterium]
MLTLKDLQSEFLDYILHSKTTTLLPQIAPDERFSATKRLNVYHKGYRLRLLEILSLDFSKTHSLMGDEQFEKAFFQYLEHHPSHHFSVRYFGQHFQSFLENTSPFKDIPVFAEMAKFEWSVAYTFDAADGPILTLDEIKSLPAERWGTIRFILHPSVISHYFKWDIPQIWLLMDNDEPPRPPMKQAYPIRWLFWRKGLRNLFQSCSIAEDKLFQSLVKGDDFAEMCENLIDLLPEDEIPQIVAGTLMKWISEEMISEIR